MAAVNRSGVRRNEVPQLEAAIKGGVSPIQVAKQFRMSLEATINYFKLYEVDVSDFDDVVGGSAIPTAQMAGELVDLRKRLKTKNVASSRSLEKKDARIAELEAEIAEMGGSSAKTKVVAKVENDHPSLATRQPKKETGGK